MRVEQYEFYSGFRECVTDLPGHRIHLSSLDLYAAAAWPSACQ